MCEKDRGGEVRSCNATSWPNIPVELTAHSTYFLANRQVLSCGPPLTGGVRRTMRLCMLKFVEGDLLQATEEYIAHGVAEGNQEGLGTGLALKISKRWPEVQAAFKKRARSGTFKGGTIWVHERVLDGPGIVYLAILHRTDFNSF